MNLSALINRDCRTVHMNGRLNVLEIRFY